MTWLAQFRADLDADVGGGGTSQEATPKATGQRPDALPATPAADVSAKGGFSSDKQAWVFKNALEKVGAKPETVHAVEQYAAARLTPGEISEAIDDLKSEDGRATGKLLAEAAKSWLERQAAADVAPDTRDLDPVARPPMTDDPNVEF